MKRAIVPLSLKDAPSLIEVLLPVQKLSVESFNEQEARQSKTLTTLGSYWKGRKPLILNRACVLGALLPFTGNKEKDLEVFEMLLAMDDLSMKKRLGLGPADSIPLLSYRELAATAMRPEEVNESLYDHVWKIVNEHLGTSAVNILELTEQLGLMRFGRRPIVSDTFCGSGQIPFEAARVGCDVYASDLNPVACMLTWGAFNIVGATNENYTKLQSAQSSLFKNLSRKIEEMGIESDGNGWLAKAFLYCTESTCPQSGWTVPLLPSLLISKGHKVIAELEPNAESKTYRVKIKYNATEEEMANAFGTVRSEGRDSYLIHSVDGNVYKTKISTLRGDYVAKNGLTSNRLRPWVSSDFEPRGDDIFRERLYAILWTKKGNGKSVDHEFREVGADDLERERRVSSYVRDHLSEWQKKGLVPDMKIESGQETDRLLSERGWTYWHHLFNPRQILICATINELTSASLKFGFFQVLNNNSKLSRWNARSGVGQTASVFDNQALNTLFNYGTRATSFCEGFLTQEFKHFPISSGISVKIENHPASSLESIADIFVTDPPYGDAVKYEEILEYFIGWLRNCPPREFSNWIWDSRRALAIKGEDEDFRREMVAAYSRMTEKMSDSGLQIIMFTHQSGAIWADMANIVWASGLQVTAAWYVVTETDSALRDGSYVKGTVLLVLRKRIGKKKTSRDDLAWEIQEEVERQVKELTGLNQTIKRQNRNENVFEDADLQMAGYAAALRVLTKYSTIDGRDMPSEAVKPRVRGQTTFVDSLIEFAVSTANQSLVPEGLDKSIWDKLMPAERFILKMTDMESKGLKTLDNYQNFAKAFKVRDFMPFMFEKKANESRLKGASEFGKTELSEGSELYLSTLRAIYYAVYELNREVDASEVLQHLSFNVKDYFAVPSQRELVVAISEYLAKKLEVLRPKEASSARVLAELVRNQRLG